MRAGNPKFCKLATVNLLRVEDRDAIVRVGKITLGKLHKVEAVEP